MCGIAGFFESSVSRFSYKPNVILRDMAATIGHRGPDAEGVWFDGARVGLAHRRLSIVDLSSSGNQPMISEDGRYVLIFNGEIYNYVELSNELPLEARRSESDTAVLLSAIQQWGVEESLKRVVGMFAFAVLDRHHSHLYLARDRFGEKPLFYGWQGNTFLFGSELKSMSAHPSWNGEVDRNSLGLFIQYGYVPLPFSIWKGIKKLQPGSFIKISIGTRPGFIPDRNVFWRAATYQNINVVHNYDDSIAIDQLESKLRDILSRQMRADVNVGAFLSGGIDSSTLVALMQSQSSRPVQTFTIGFAESDYNEAKYAKAIASYLGTDHSELYVSPKDAMSIIPRLSHVYDEPFGDVSQIPTYLISSLARNSVKVSISGDGGDELFGGYNRHVWGAAGFKKMFYVPRMIRYALSEVLTSVSPERLDRLGRILPQVLRQPMFGDRVHKLARVLSSHSPDQVYRGLTSHEEDPPSLVILDSADDLTIDSWAQEELSLLSSGSFIERMMFHDVVSYLTDDILCKVDRASMASGLETRMPFLDHNLAEFLWSLPETMKVRGREGKWLLRQVLYRHIPRTLVERPKQGFGVPIDSWLRGPLRDWAEELLDNSRIKSEGFFHAQTIEKKWQEHISGRRNWQYWLWNVLTFQAWRETWCG